MNKLVVFIVLLHWGNIAFPQGLAADVEDLKVAFVYNFSKYITWPDSAFTPADDLTFCIAGDDSLRNKFNVLVGKITSQKKIRILTMQVPEQAKQECHVVYVSDGYENDTGKLLASMNDSPVLTVGDSSGFNERGGVIELMEVDERIVFSINQAQALAKHLVISSSLLRLAR